MHDVTGQGQAKETCCWLLDQIQYVCVACAAIWVGHVEGHC